MGISGKISRHQWFQLLSYASVPSMRKAVELKINMPSISLRQNRRRGRLEFAYTLSFRRNLPMKVLTDGGSSRKFFLPWAHGFFLDLCLAIECSKVFSSSPSSVIGLFVFLDTGLTSRYTSVSDAVCSICLWLVDGLFIGAWWCQEFCIFCDLLQPNVL